MEEEKDKLVSGNVVINVTILDRRFKYTVPQEDESLIRNTIKGLSEKLSDFKLRKNFHDNQELLTVALVQTAVEKARLEAVLGDMRDSIQLLDSQLDEYIENNVRWMKTGLGDPQGDSVLPDVGSLSPQSELKSYFLGFSDKQCSNGFFLQQSSDRNSL